MDKTRFNQIIDQELELTPPTMTQGQGRGRKSLDTWRFFTKARKCPDCPELVKDRKIEIYVKYMGTPRQHWTARCSKCGKNPFIQTHNTETNK